MTDNLLDNEPIARKNLVLFYLIDTSGSMEGTKIGTVNTVMEETIPEVRGVGGSDADVKVAVMTFDDDVKWIYDHPISVEEFTWKRLDAGGWTCMGDAFDELNEKLSRTEYLQSPSLSFAPVIFLLSDGYPNPGYEKPLEKLKRNRWFKYSLKIAFAVGQDADKDVLSDFTGNPESVVTVNNGKALARLIKKLTVKSSQIGSKSYVGGDEPLTDDQADQMKQNELLKEIKNSVEPGDLEFDDGW